MPQRIEILEKLPDAVTLHDAADGTVLWANQAFCKLLGYSQDELDAISFDDLHVNERPYTTEGATEYIRKAATEGPQRFEWLDETKAGDSLPVEVSLKYTSINRNDRIIAVVRDITERKERERELERERDRFEQFANVVSHDLRNPLRVAEGRLGLAREVYDSEHLDTVARAHERMDALD